MLNAFETRGDITVIFIHASENETFECLIDTSDLPRAQEVPGSWYVRLNPMIGRYYIWAQYMGKTISLGRFITGVDKHCTVRYRDENGFDNRRSNLVILDRKKKLQLQNS